MQLSINPPVTHADTCWGCPVHMVHVAHGPEHHVMMVPAQCQVQVHAHTHTHTHTHTQRHQKKNNPSHLARI